jgi:hypothetical protein
MSNDSNLRFILADNSSVGIVSRAWDGQQGNRVSISGSAIGFTVLHNVQTGSRTNWASYGYRGVGGWYLYLVPRLRMVELHRHPAHTLSRSGALEWTHFRHTFISFTQRKRLIRERINMRKIHHDTKRCIPCWSDTLNITSEWKSAHKFCRGTVFLLYYKNRTLPSSTFTEVACTTCEITFL